MYLLISLALIAVGLVLIFPPRFLRQIAKPPALRWMGVAALAAGVLLLYNVLAGRIVLPLN